MSYEKSAIVNPPGFVPCYGQGLRAKESQLGAIGTKEWLKSIKLHKYWPLISHWSYWQMLALTKENMEYNIKFVGGTEITHGAQGKLLRSIEELRERRFRLKNIIQDLGSSGNSLENELSYIQKVIYTPFPTSEEDSLPILVVHTIQKIKEHIILNESCTQGVRRSIDLIDKAIKRNLVLYRAEENLKNMPFLWDIHSFSMDSGFGENSEASLPKKQPSTKWTSGMDSIMYNAWKTYEYTSPMQGTVEGLADFLVSMFANPRTGR
ncbi:unnamed protein product [Nezara viridula]|uniref:Uncharacterized protein n=1 Tax=Nezara viridula TaxID=85310 RepID=A0A9P0HHF0_NEZVI|nr:unnamed protein product [Nezara viridula]